MNDFIENLIVEFPGGKVELEWYDWIGLAAVVGLTVVGSIKLSKQIKRIEASKSGVRIETKNKEQEEN